MRSESAQILMCSPEFYGIEYEINPWMHRDQAVDHDLACEQWTKLVDSFKSLGARIRQIQPVRGLPDMVFTANAGVVHRQQFVTSRFRHEQRRGESEHFEEWFSENEFQIAGLATPAAFEGAGDALFCGDTLFAGYRHRSEIASHQCLADWLGYRVLSLELPDPRFYHLDTCFCPLSVGLAMYYPGAFDDYGERVLRASIPTLIEVTEPDAVRFGCNAVVIGNDVVFNTGCDELARTLEQHGFSPHQTPLSEFLKSGGAAKCLTLRLDGEEAAGWKQLEPGP